MLFEPAGVSPALVMPAALAVVQPVGTLRWASAGYLSAATDSPASTLWEPRLTGDVQISQAAADAVGIGGVLPVGIADIGMADADGALADLDKWGTADGRRISITVIAVEDARASDFGTPLAGRVVGMRLNLMTGAYSIARTDPIAAFAGITSRIDRNADRTGTLRMTDVVERLSSPLQPRRLPPRPAGTGPDQPLPGRFAVSRAARASATMPRRSGKLITTDAVRRSTKAALPPAITRATTGPCAAMESQTSPAMSLCICEMISHD